MAGKATHNNHPDPHAIRDERPENEHLHTGPSQEQLALQARIDERRAAACKAGRLMVLDAASGRTSVAQEYFLHSSRSWVANGAVQLAEVPSRLEAAQPKLNLAKVALTAA